MDFVYDYMDKIILYLGIINFGLLLFQILTGLRVIKVKHKIHKYTAFVFLVTAISHAVFAVWMTL